MLCRRSFYRRSVILIIGLLITMGESSALLAELPPVNTTVGVRGGEDTVEGFLDLIGPVWAPGNGLLFINPRIALRDQGENAFNVGLGYRHLLPGPDMVLGVNAFLDAHESRYNNRFYQMGAGIEFLSKWVDARANLYRPENNQELAQEYWQTEVGTRSRTDTDPMSDWRWNDIRPAGHTIVGKGTYDTTTTTTTTTTRRLFQMYETALDGWDAEIGGRLPLPDSFPEIRLFGGYYSFEGEYGDDIEGLKGRLELRTGPYLTFDAQVFEDKELNGSDYFVGVRLQIPFSGTNPFSEMSKLFKPAPRSQQERQSRELVMRDMRIQTDISDFIEDAAARTEDVDTDVAVAETTETLVLADHITFVDGDTTAAIENGTAENPFNLIQEGSDNAGANNTILVDDATGGYYEQVVLANNQTLTSAVDLRYNAGTYQSDQIPTVFSPKNPATLILANNNTVRRMALGGQRGVLGAGIRNATIDGVIIRSSGPAIRFIDTTGNLQVVNSVVENYGFGDTIDIDLNDNQQANVLIADSTILSAEDGIDVALDDNSIINLALTNNVITADSDGLLLELDDSSLANVTIGHNMITVMRGGDEGLDFDIDDDARLYALIHDNLITNNGTSSTDYGIEVELEDAAFADITIRNNTVITEGGRAIEFEMDDDSSANLRIIDNTLESKGDDGIEIELDDNASLNVQIVNNTITAEDEGIDIDIDDNSRLNVQILDNTITAGDSGIDIYNDSNNTTHGLCADINGNTITSGPGNFDIDLDNDGALFRVRNLPMLSQSNSWATWTNNGTTILDCLFCPELLLP